MVRLAFDVDMVKRAAAILIAAFTLTACAGTNVVADKARRFDQATASYDAGDYATAYAIWSQLADENDLAAMRNTAHLLRKGLGVEKNPGRALDLYTEAARKGLVLAMANVAEMHLTGEGTLKDPEEAARWYALAANGGLSIAMVRLAEMLEQGNGVTKDIARAQELYAKAAQNGYVPAQDKARAQPVSAASSEVRPVAAAAQSASDPFRRRVSQPVVEAGDRRAAVQEPQRAVTPPAQTAAALAGKLDPIDPAAANGLSAQDAQRLQAGWVAYEAGQMNDAFKLWRALADKGVADAQARIGGMFEHGLGVGRDMIEAYRWYKLGATSNNMSAAAGAARVASKLSPAEKAIAESMAASPQHWQSRRR